MRTTKPYAYIVARDFGFAPNPYFGSCTLATCKKIMRRVAGRGDWIIGLGGAKYNLRERIVYAMQVTESMTYDEYWDDARFRQKRPVMTGSLKQLYGDNIYHHCERTGEWLQENSHHSLEGGAINMRTLEDDTQTDRVLISAKFVYWGSKAPLLPRSLRMLRGILRHHRCNFQENVVERLVRWLDSRGEWGCVGEPAEYARYRTD